MAPSGPSHGNVGVIGKYGAPIARASSRDSPTFPLLGPLGAIPLPSRWRLEFGEPIRTDTYGEGAADDRALVFELSERVRDEIQRMVYENLVRRGSAFT